MHVFGQHVSSVTHVSDDFLNGLRQSRHFQWLLKSNNLSSINYVYLTRFSVKPDAMNVWFRRSVSTVAWTTDEGTELDSHWFVDWAAELLFLLQVADIAVTPIERFLPSGEHCLPRKNTQL